MKIKNNVLILIINNKKGLCMINVFVYRALVDFIQYKKNITETN